MVGKSFPAASGALQQNIIVEGVQGFAQFEHGVVGGIHQGINRAHTASQQAQLHFVGAGLDFYVLDQAEYKTGVQFRIADLNGDTAFQGWPIHGDAQIRVAQFSAGDGSHLTCDADNIGIACEVRRDGNIVNGIAHIVYQAAIPQVHRHPGG